MTTFDEFREGCEYILDIPLEPRRGNVVAMEISKPLDRCARQSPDGRGLIWLYSGGDAASYGICCRKNCPRLHSDGVDIGDGT